ncbi:MAG: beta-ribofuranosylaminobenzene 5'-phosphate synthase family protein [Candidatus Hodarchaeales archaeon]
MLQVEVKTPSRLHFGLIDLSGELGRVDGGAGVALKAPSWHLTLSLYEDKTDSSGLIVKGHQTSLAESIAYRYFERKGISILNCHLDVQQAIPSHVGLGSKTQLCLALGSALEMISQRLSDKPPVHHIARLMQRGGTSGIGVNSFARGGFCVDCGHSYGPGKEKESFLPSRASHATPPPVVLNAPFPEEWPIILAIPNVSLGVCGESEIAIFQKNCPLGSNDAETLSRTVLMQIIPSILEKDIEAFSEGLKTFQMIGFKKIEIFQQDSIVQELIGAAELAGAAASGMSSFGPTTFCVVDSQKKAAEIRNLWQDTMNEKMGGRTDITLANNTGADISFISERLQSAKSESIQIHAEL